jgi:hypothetical protein
MWPVPIYKGGRKRRGREGKKQWREGNACIECRCGRGEGDKARSEIEYMMH